MDPLDLEASYHPLASLCRLSEIGNYDTGSDYLLSTSLVSRPYLHPAIYHQFTSALTTFSFGLVSLLLLALPFEQRLLLAASERPNDLRF